MKVMENPIKKALEKHWSQWGLAAAVCTLIGMAASWPRFSRNPYWFLWMLVPLLMLHNFEESCFPGNFLPWFNRICFQSGDDYFPCTRLSSAIFAMVTCWGLNLLAAIIAPHFIFLAVTMSFFLLQNAWMHMAYTLSSAQYSPGAITSFVILVPFCSYILYHLYVIGTINHYMLILGYIVGSLMHFGMFVMLRNRQNRSKIIENQTVCQ